MIGLQHPEWQRRLVFKTFEKTSYKCAVNNPDESIHQYTPLHTWSLNAQLLSLMEELGIDVQL